MVIFHFSYYATVNGVLLYFTIFESNNFLGAEIVMNRAILFRTHANVVLALRFLML